MYIYIYILGNIRTVWHISFRLDIVQKSLLSLKSLKSLLKIFKIFLGSECANT